MLLFNMYAHMSHPKCVSSSRGIAQGIHRVMKTGTSCEVSWNLQAPIRSLSLLPSLFASGFGQNTAHLVKIMLVPSTIWL